MAKHRTVAALLTAAAMTLSLGRAAPVAAESIEEAVIATSVNAVRSANGVAPLRVDGRLADIARAWSVRMAAAGSISHNPDLASQIPLDWRTYGENVAVGSEVATIHLALVNSAAHFRNLIDPRFTSIGVGVVRSGLRLWVTEVFMQGDAAAPGPPTPAPPQQSGTNWYRMVDAGGEVYGFGAAGVLPSAATAPTVVAMASTPSGGGYWTVTSSGSVSAVGDAAFFGPTATLSLSQPVVGMAATPTGRGYWLVARDGGVFSFGDARFFGSTGAISLNQPIVGMSATPSGKGYWFVASDGGVFAFGDAAFRGSTGAIRLNQPVVGMASSPAGGGYWLVARDGGIFAFGDARFFGSTGAIRLNQPIVGMAPTPAGTGYRFVAADGGVFSFGDADFLGSTGDRRLARPIVGLVSGA